MRNKIISSAALLASLLANAHLCEAQGVRRDDFTIDANGKPVGFVGLRVCNEPVSQTLPCAPAAQVFTDVALTQRSPNPLIGDAFGNTFFFAVPGFYRLEFSAAGLTPKVFANVLLPTVVLNPIPSGSITLPVPGGASGAIQFNNAGAFGGDTNNFSYNSTTKRLCLGPINGGAAACGAAADFEVVPVGANIASFLLHVNSANMGQAGQIAIGNQFGTFIIGKESTAGGSLGFGGLAAQANVIGNLSSNSTTQFFSNVSQSTGTGGISTVVVGVGGSGYTVGDVLTISGGGNGLAQVNVDTVSGGGVVTGVSPLVSYPGNGYTTGTYATTGGTGASATVTVTNVKVTQVNATINGQTGDFASRAIIDAGTGFRVAGAAPSGNYVRCDGTKCAPSALLTSDLPTDGAVTRINSTLNDGSPVTLFTSAGALYRLSGYVVCRTVGAGTSLAVSLSYTDNAGTQTAPIILTTACDTGGFPSNNTSISFFGKAASLVTFQVTDTGGASYDFYLAATRVF